MCPHLLLLLTRAPPIPCRRVRPPGPRFPQGGARAPRHPRLRAGTHEGEVHRLRAVVHLRRPASGRPPLHGGVSDAAAAGGGGTGLRCAEVGSLAALAHCPSPVRCLVLQDHEEERRGEYGPQARRRPGGVEHPVGRVRQHPHRRRRCVVRGQLHQQPLAVSSSHFRATAGMVRVGIIATTCHCLSPLLLAAAACLQPKSRLSRGARPRPVASSGTARRRRAAPRRSSWTTWRAATSCR